MEGYGFLHGAYANDAVDALVVRGISDLLSGKTETADQEWQPAASQHAAAFAFELLARTTTKPPNDAPAAPEIQNTVAGNLFGPVLQAGHIGGSAVLAGPVTVNYHGQLPESVPLLSSLAVPGRRPGHRTRGRSGVIETVAGVVRSDEAAVVVLHGAGGYGKTTVAAEVARAVAGEVDVWWVDASSEETLITGLRTVAIRASVDRERVHNAWSSGTESAPDLLWEALGAATKKWLLVLDNADDPRILAPGDGRVSRQRGWLRTPPAGTGTVLVTSRTASAEVWGNARLLRVDALSADDGARVLLDRVPDAGSAAEAITLADRLGGLPLALWLAGSYLASARTAPPIPGLDLATTFESYRTAWEQRFADVTDLSWSTEHPDDRELLSRTWELSLDLLEQRGHRLARPLLRTLSCLGPSPVPHALLDADVLTRSPLFPELTAPLLRTLLVALDDLGLIQPGQHCEDEVVSIPTVGMHPVIRDANRQHVQRGDRPSSFVEIALYALLQSIEPLDATQPATWPLWRTLIPHCVLARTVARDENELRRVRLGAALVCHLAAFFCQRAGLDDEAVELNRTAVACRAAILGPDAPETLAVEHNLANNLESLGRLVEAEAGYRRVLAVERAVRGDEDIETLVTRNALAGVLRERGELKAAEDEFRQVLDIVNRTKIPYDPSVLNVHDGLAATLRDRGDLVAAEDLLRQLLSHAQQRLGADHQYTLGVALNLASVLHDRARLDEAEHLCRQILPVAERVLESHHQQVLQIQNLLATLYFERGELAEAENLFQEVLQKFTDTKGAEHYMTIAVRSNLAEILVRRGLLAEAETEFRAILETNIRNQGREHPQTRGSLRALAQVLTMRGDVSSAEGIYRDALIGRPESSAGGLEVLELRAGRADALRVRGDYVAAEREYRDIAEISTRIHGSDHVFTLTILNNLSTILLARGSVTEAETLLRQILASREHLGDMNPSVVATRSNLAGVLHARGHLRQSEREYRAILPIAKHVQGEEHPDTLAIQCSLGTVLRNQDKLTEAEELFRKTATSAEKVLGSNHPNTLKTRSCIADVLRERGKNAEAEREYRRVLDGLASAGQEESETARMIRFNLALAVRDLGKLVDAEEILRKLLVVEQRLLGSKTESTLVTQLELAATLFQQQRLIECETVLRDLILKAQQSLGTQHQLTQHARGVLALFFNGH
ncbi:MULTISPECIES: tetratricopeptide repeat protein [Amycolatopsis]|uniref:Tetratricopeptide repeat protein n=1 Tax=Amycolatopsis albidoflavus TaxID=102226 RepID=A0ABW5HVH8_9PSEU